jgi:hypothetical protein
VREIDIRIEVQALERLDLQGLRTEWSRRWGAVPKLRQKPSRGNVSVHSGRLKPR